MLRSLLLLDLCRLTYQRLVSRPALSLLALVGIVLAVGLVTSAPFFSQAVDRVILQQELDALSQETGRVPFSTRVYFQPSSRKPLSLVDAENVGRSIGDTIAAEIGLPLDHMGIQVESGGLMLLPAPDDARYTSKNSFLNTVNAAYVGDVAEHLEIVAGEPFASYEPSAPETLDVWMHVRLAEEMGLHVGESFQVARHTPLYLHSRLLAGERPDRPLLVQQPRHGDAHDSIGNPHWLPAIYRGNVAGQIRLCQLAHYSR